jgi:ribosomal protein L24
VKGKEVEVLIEISHVNYLVVVDGVTLPKSVVKSTGLFRQSDAIHHFIVPISNVRSLSFMNFSKVYKIILVLLHKGSILRTGSTSDLSTLKKISTANIVVKSLQYQELRGEVNL